LSNRLAAKRGVGAIIGHVPIVVGELDEAHILDPVPLARCYGKNDHLGEVVAFLTEKAHPRIVRCAPRYFFDPWGHGL